MKRFAFECAANRVRMTGVLLWLCSIAVILPLGAAHAVPMLGVATDNGYVCAAEESECPTDYQTYFGGEILTGPIGGAEEGFIIGPSGDTLIVWSHILDSDIWLLTDSELFTTIDPTIDGTALSEVSVTGSFGAYDPTPYYGINLGAVDTSDGWYELSGSAWSPSPFYARELTLAYTGDIRDVAGHYIFAVADDNGVDGLQASRVTGPGGAGPDRFSPKTTSAVAIPEPSGLALMGVALTIMGLTMSGRRRRQETA